MTSFIVAAPMRITVAASVVMDADSSVVTGPPAATAFTLSGSSSGTTSVPATFTVTPNGVVSGTVVVSLAATNAGSVSPSTLTFTNSSAAQTFTVTRTTDGTSSVSMTNNGGLTNAGTPISFATTSASPGDITTFTVTSSSGGSNLPFAIGHAFRQGDVPSGTPLGGDSSLQITIKNAWPDGSAKFAVIAGRKTLTAGVASTVTLRTNGSVTSGGSLSITDLKATGVTAAISFAGVSVSWATTDWDSPAQTLTSGPELSSWTYRKQIGSDAHLVGWLEVRLHAGGHVQVLPWIENGYLSVASPTAKTGRAVFTLNGSVKYDSINDANFTGPYDSFVCVNAGTVQIAAQCRVCLVSGTQIAHWAGTDPQITPSHNVAYLASTKVVPAYRPTSITEAAIVEWCVTNGSYSPMRTQLTQGMGGTGYSHDIGMLPMNSAIYLVNGDTRAYKAVLNWGFSLGSHAIHYRDQTTNRPLLFATFPNKSTNTGSDLTPTPTGGEPFRYATSHHPAAAYLPYLISGWNWFVEATQFQVTSHYLAMPPASRQTSNCFFTPSAGAYGHNNQGGPRAVGWQWRTMAMCASITPDADTTMRAQFVTALGYNATSYREIHETGTWSGGLAWAPNNLGLMWEPGFPTTDNGKCFGATWQDDFVTMSVGFSWDLDVVTDATAKANLLWFRDFKYKAIVGRLGAQNDVLAWNYRDAAPYNIYIGVPGGGGTTMNWYDTWGEAFSANYPVAGNIGQSHAASNTGLTGNDLLNGNIGGNGMSTSYFGNLQPAISYAVSHEAPGAHAAYTRMATASNWATTITEFNSVPIWGVKPRAEEATVLSAAAAGMSAGQWLQVTAAAVPSSSTFFNDDLNGKIYGYCHKMAYDPVNRQVRFAGKGHLGRHKLVNYDEATNTWSKVTPSFNVDGETDHGYHDNTIDPLTGDHYYRRFNNTVPLRYTYSTGLWSTLPADGGTHTQGGQEFHPSIGAQGGLVSVMGTSIRRWDKATNTWSTAQAITQLTNYQMAMYSPIANVVYVSNDTAWWVVGATGTPTTITSAPISINSANDVALVCPVSGDILLFSMGSPPPPVAYKWNGSAWSALSLSGAPTFPLYGDTSGIMATPLAPYGVVMFMFGTTGAVWLYKHA